ncbi:hypothetical protein PFICI_09375 [Pestalotiopsis fici W106-1]|uniref:Uncharacterized protein n=1 Tax=Pestalotiopsis fici (strain W106-1 / CGMCC3.15140) TaxID=1229662 RepID=W3X2A8_PESFW|nr:uncharacterized protein PFICI_09375 [Pestalotiopsis fici W106-1]ETS79522.1 hypothetical protein PFICI_09375 [Pestalotiopsis fici W106-1]
MIVQSLPIESEKAPAELLTALTLAGTTIDAGQWGPRASEGLQTAVTHSLPSVPAATAHNHNTVSRSPQVVESSTPVASYPPGTESGSSPTGSAETPGTQITSTITSTSMITITSCGPE